MFYSAAGQVSTWLRQGVESFVAVQKILLDLTAQQNALAIGVVRERVKLPQFKPGAALVKMAHQAVSGGTEAGKILLEFAAGETGLAIDGMKEVLRLGPATGTMAEGIRFRAETLIEMHRKLLDGIAGQMDAVAGSYEEGNGLMGGSTAAELAKKAMEGFVQTEKRFLNLVQEEVVAAADGERAPKAAGRDRGKALTQLAHDAVEKYIEAQKQLLGLAIHQLEAGRKAAAAAAKEAEAEPATSISEVTKKSVKNFVAAEKSLLDLAVNPPKASDKAAEYAKAAPKATRRKHAAAKRANA